MTQLFDTETYDEALEGTQDNTDLGGRHLRSMPTGQSTAERTTQWRLDADTIEIGRKGLLAARQALQDAAKTAAKKQTRKAA